MLSHHNMNDCRLFPKSKANSRDIKLFHQLKRLLSGVTQMLFFMLILTVGLVYPAIMTNLKTLLHLQVLLHMTFFH